MEDRYCVRMEGIKKSFEGIRVLGGVSLAIRPGEIHTLVGENGAGKPALMKILSDAYRKDEGAIEIGGVPVEIGSPCRGRELGVGVTYQEFELASDLMVTEGILLNRLSNGKLVDWKHLYEKAKAVLHSLNFDINMKSRVQSLSVAYRQVVEIAKVPSQDAKILILDKPTAALSPKEAAALFETLDKLRSKGVSVIHISYRMEEISQIADSITIIYNSEVTDTGRRDQMEMNQVIELTIDRKLSTMLPPRIVEVGEEILWVGELKGEVFRRISFSMRRGEMFGISGLVGSNRSEVVRAIFGADRKRSRKVHLNGREATVHFPKDTVRFGIGLIPGDHKEQGLALDFATKHNITMPDTRSVRGFLDVIWQEQKNRLTQSLVKKLTVKADDIDAAMHQLGGGSQQKVVLAKWFNTDSQVVTFDEPTRGVDIGARIEIYDLISEFAKRNLGVIIISSEPNKIVGTCD